MKTITPEDLQPQSSPGDGWFIIEAAGDHPNTIIFPDGKQQDIVQHLTTDVLETIAEADVPPEGVPVDKDHCSYSAGGTTEALGWVRELAMCGGDLAGFIEWTPLGLPLIQGKVYKHFSTVYPVDPEQITPDGLFSPAQLIGLALTNQPNNKTGQPPITNREPATTKPTTKTMNPEILAALGLAEGATDDEILAAIQALKDGANAAAEAEADALISNEEQEADAQLTNEEKEDCKEQILSNREHGLKFTRLLCRDKARATNRQPATGRRYADNSSTAKRTALLNGQSAPQSLTGRRNARATAICNSERTAGRKANWHVAFATASREITE